MLTKQIFLYCQLIFTAIAFAFCPPTVKAENISKPTHRILKSASELDYPPFALVRPDGSADGFSVDLVKAVAHSVGIEINFVVGPWHQIKQKLSDGRLDVLPLVSYSKDREKIFDFTAPYLRMHGTIFVRKGEKKIRGETDLKNREVFVMRGDAAHEYAVGKNLSEHLILTESFEEAMKRLSRGEHDAVIIQQVVGHQIINKLGITNLVDVRSIEQRSLKPVGKPLSDFEQKFCIAVKDGDRELLAALNEGLAIVISDGTYDQLYNKWFEPILPQPPISLSRILKYSLIIIGPIFFLMAIVTVWYLKREVSKKTINLRQEIEERKRAEEALQESEARLAESNQLLAGVLEHTHMMAVFLDRHFNFIWVNRAYADTCGKKPSFFPGKNHFDLYPHEENQAIFQHVADTGEPFFIAAKPFEFPDQPERGVTYWDWSLIPVTDDSGKVTNLVFTLAEVTDRIRAEEEVLKSRDELEQRVRERTTELELRNQELRYFAFAASHDLQEPVRKLQTFADIIATRWSDSIGEQGRDYVRRMAETAQRMQALLLSLLEYSRLNSKDEPFKRINLKEIVEAVLSDLEVQIKEAKASVDIGELPEMEADAAQIASLFQNLIGNAIKFRREGDPPRVKIYCNFEVDSRSQKEEWEILVEDNGIGFDEEQMDNIFRPFQRLHGRREYAGVGMGLAICRKVVERHGGAITAKSTPERGATFIVRLPRRQ